MFNSAQAKDFAQRWLQAISSHNLDEMLASYADDAELQSPAVTTLVNEPGGKIRGRAALRTFFASALAAYPHMNMHLIEVAVGISSITIWYANHRGTRTSACLEFNAAGKIVRNLTHYSDWKT